MTTWTNEQLLEGVASVNYDDATVDYDDNYNYNGQATTVWTNESTT